MCAAAVLRGRPPAPEGALKNPSCRVAVEGRAQELDWSALCAPAKYENVVPLHGYHPHPQAGLSSNYHGHGLSIRDAPGSQAAGTPGFAVPLTSGAAAPTPGAEPVSPDPVLMRASTLGAAMGRATR